MLFKTSKAIKALAGMTEVNFISIQATVQSVEDKHIIPFIGRAQYDALQAAYTATVEDAAIPNAPLQALLIQCRKIVAPYSCYYYTPKADVMLSDAGLQRQETQTTKSAYQRQTSNFLEAYLQEAETATENLISFLETNKGNYPLWVASNEYKTYKSLFIKTGSDFQQQFPSQSPYRNYWALRGFMISLEEMAIREFLGDDLFDALKTKDTAGTALTDKEKILMTKIKKAIAFLTVAQAIPFLNVKITENGLTVTTIGTRSDDDKVSSRSAADAKSIDALIKACTNSGKSWIDNAAKYLRTNAEEFSTWPGNMTKFSNKNSSLNCNNGLFGL